MYKPIVLVALLALSFSDRVAHRRRPPGSLGPGTMQLEHVVGGEAVVRIEAESEDPLGRVEVRDPHGHSFLQFDARAERGLSGLVMELREASLDEVLARYAEGEYELRATTVDGGVALGAARLSFDLPSAPRIVHPRPNAIVSSRGLTVLWLPEAGIAGYRVQLEVGENDGLAVTLPPGQGSFRVPDGLLPSGEQVQLELSAIGANGNRTVVELEFSTLP